LNPAILDHTLEMIVFAAPRSFSGERLWCRLVYRGGAANRLTVPRLNGTDMLEAATIYRKPLHGFMAIA
jgi:hypothetical protein